MRTLFLGIGTFDNIKASFDVWLPHQTISLLLLGSLCILHLTWFIFKPQWMCMAIVEKVTEHVYVQIGSILHFYLKYSLNKKSFLYMSAIKQNEFSRKNIFLLQLAVIS